MKTFKNVAEWLKSNPSEDEMKKVLNIINTGAKREARAELYKKQAELKKAGKFALQMKEMGFKISADVTAKINELTNDVKQLESQVGPVVKRGKKEKKEKGQNEGKTE